MKTDKILFIAVNSSYVHTCPAVRNLAVVCGGEWREFNINQQQPDVLGEIYKLKPQIAAFSCYIWNITYVLKLAGDLKKILPDVIIMLGGPEVSFNAREIMQANAFVDVVFCGEAEETVLFIDKIGHGANMPPGILYRENGRLTGSCDYAVTKDISCVPRPFENYSYDETKIFYYESSRGCPFNCAYCLSGAAVPVREKPLEIVFADILSFIDRGAKLLKFTDRTFNANAARAAEIIRYVIELNTSCTFHFEVGLDLMDDHFVDLLLKAPNGRIQLEAGVQTCNAQTLAAVARKQDLEALEANAKKIIDGGNIDLHLDLIAGLPYEDMASFEESFDRIISLYPHYLQLGFLKLLRGSRLREEAAQRGIVYRDYPPYEVLYTREISAEELLTLKGIEELLNRYYNTGRALNALSYLFKNKIVKPFAYFLNLYGYCDKNGFVKRPVSAAAQFEILLDHAKITLKAADYTAFVEHLSIDYQNAKIKGRAPQELQNLRSL